MAYHAKTQKRYEETLTEEKKRHRNNLRSFASAKSFIRNHATQEQLKEIEDLINQYKNDDNVTLNQK